MKPFPYLVSTQPTTLRPSTCYPYTTSLINRLAGTATNFSLWTGSNHLTQTLLLPSP